MILQSRRSLIVGMASLLAAPAIVRVSNLMPVKVMEVVPWYDDLKPQTVYYIGDYIKFMNDCNNEMFRVTGIDNVSL